MSEETIYARDQPIWWCPRSKPEPIPGYFVMYRKSKAVIDILQSDGSRLRKMAFVSALRLREEEKV